MKGASAPPAAPDTLPDPRIFIIVDDRVEAGSEEAETTPISETEAEVDELPVDVDMVRYVSLPFNEVEE